MICNFEGFRIDKIFESLISESYIYFSNEFREILKRMKDNDIAKDILSVEKTDVKPDMTFIGKGDKEGHVKFNQMNKALTQISKWGEETGNKVEHGLEMIPKGGFDNYDDWDFYGNTFSHFPTLKGNEVKIGKLVNGIFPGKYTGAQVEEFVTKFKTYSMGDITTFDIVYGEDIRYWYLGDNYSSITGSLGNSCMRYRSCQGYLDIYTENVDQCRLLILKDDDNKLLGRALVWLIDSGLESDYFMDRIYVTEDKYMNMFKDYADKEGWSYRTSTSYSDNKTVTFKNEIHENIKLLVNLTKYDFDEYPYMDTFKKLDIRSGKLINDDEVEDGYYVLENTDGTYNEGNYVYSEYHEMRIREDEAVWSRPLQDWILDEDTVYVEVGSSRYRGIYPIGHEDLVYDEYRDESIHREEAIWCDFEDTYFYEDDAITVITRFNGVNDYYDEPFSDLDSKAIPISRMSCFDFLTKNDIDDYYYIHKSILDQDVDGDYYFSKFSINLFVTEEGDYSLIDSKILGLDINKDTMYETDEFTYNDVILGEDGRDKIRKVCKEKIEYYESILDGDQTRLSFEDDEDYINKIKSVMTRYNDRLDVLDSFE